MKKDKIDIITVYSHSNFVETLLTQTCKNFSLKTLPYSAFTSAVINTEASISVIDVKNQIVFDKIIKPLLRFRMLYPVIILVPSNVIFSQISFTNAATILVKPLKYQTLLKTITNNSTNFVYKLAHSIFLDTQSLSVVKIFQENTTEIQLTHSEYKILKYLLETRKLHKCVTEKEILTNVFGYHALSDTNTLKTHMHRLKQKLGDSDIIIRRKNRYTLCSATTSISPF